MKRLFYFAIIFFLHEKTFSQTPSGCDDIVFVKVEVLPDFNNGKKAFQDSLTAYLKKNNVSIQDGKVTFSLIVAKDSTLSNLRKSYGEIINEDRIIEGIKSIPNLWVPAKQNSHAVCSYVNLEIEIVDGKLNARRFQ